MQPLALYKSLGLSVPLGQTQRLVRPALGQLSPPADRSLLQIPLSLTLGQKLQADFLDRSATNRVVRLPVDTTSDIPMSAQLVDRSASPQETHPIAQSKGSETPAPTHHVSLKPLEQLKPLSARPPLSQASNFLTLQTASELTSPEIAPLSNLRRLKGKGATPTPEAIKAQVQTQVQAQVDRRSPLNSDLQARPISPKTTIQRQPKLAPEASELATLIPTVAATTEVLSARDISIIEDAQPSSALLQSKLEPASNPTQSNLQPLSNLEQSTDYRSEPLALPDPLNPRLSQPPSPLVEIQPQVGPSDGLVSVAAEANPISLEQQTPQSPMPETTADLAIQLKSEPQNARSVEVSADIEISTSSDEVMAALSAPGELNSESIRESPNVVQLQVEPAQINSQDKHLSDPNPSEFLPTSSTQLPELQVLEPPVSFAQPVSEIASEPIAEEFISEPRQPTIQKEEIQSGAEQTTEPRESIDSISSSIELQSQKIPLPQLEGWESNKTSSSISETVQTHPAAPTPSVRPEEAALPDLVIPKIDPLPSTSIKAAPSETVAPESLKVPVQTGQEEFETEAFQAEPLADKVQRSLDQTQLHSTIASEQAGAEASLSQTNVQSSFQQAVQQAVQQPEESVSQPAAHPEVQLQAEITVNSVFDPKSQLLELSDQAINPILQPTVQQPTANEATALHPQVLHPQLEPELDGKTSAIHFSQPSTVDGDSFTSEQPNRLPPEFTADIQTQVERSPRQATDEGTSSEPNDVAALLPDQSNVDAIPEGQPLLQPRLESQSLEEHQHPVLDVQLSRSLDSNKLEPEQNNSVQRSEAIDLSTQPSTNLSIQPVDPILPPDSVPALPTVATDLSSHPQVQPSIQAKAIRAETTTESQIADRSPQPLLSNLSTGESTKADITHNNSDIPMLSRRQLLGHTDPLANWSDLLMPKREARWPNSPSVEATSDSALSTISKLPNSAIAASDTPDAWASIDELLGQPPLSQTTVQTEPWQQQFNLHSNLYPVSETLVNRFTQPSAEIASRPQIDRNSEIDGERHYTLSSAFLSSTEAGQTKGAIAPAELELLAQMVYGLVRDRFAIDKERYLQVAASQSTWIDIISANSFKPATSTEIKSVNIQLQPAATSPPVQRQLEALTQAVYQLIRLRLEQDRERRIH